MATGPHSLAAVKISQSRMGQTGLINRDRDLLDREPLPYDFFRLACLLSILRNNSSLSLTHFPTGLWKSEDSAMKSSRRLYGPH